MVLNVYVTEVLIAAPDRPMAGISRMFNKRLEITVKIDVYIFNSGFPLPAKSFDNILSTENRIIPGNNSLRIIELS